MSPRVLFSASEIAMGVELVADEIIASPVKPDIAAPILAGAFVFAADLLRALSEKGLSLPVEFLWLRSYGPERSVGDVKILVPPTEQVSGKTVLLIDGVLDSGATVETARRLFLEQGARAVLVAVAVDKGIAATRADYACFRNVSDFIVGYGMDDDGTNRGLPYIGAV